METVNVDAQELALRYRRRSTASVYLGGALILSTTLFPLLTSFWSQKNKYTEHRVVREYRSLEEEISILQLAKDSIEMSQAAKRIDSLPDSYHSVALDLEKKKTRFDDLLKNNADVRDYLTEKDYLSRKELLSMIGFSSLAFTSGLCVFVGGVEYYSRKKKALGLPD